MSEVACKMAISLIFSLSKHRYSLLKPAILLNSFLLFFAVWYIWDEFGGMCIYTYRPQTKQICS